MCTYRTVLIFIDPLVEGHVGDLAVLSSDLETTCDDNLDENLPVWYCVDKVITLANECGPIKDCVFDFLESISEFVHGKISLAKKLYDLFY